MAGPPHCRSVRRTQPAGGELCELCEGEEEAEKQKGEGHDKPRRPVCHDSSRGPTLP